MWCQTFTLLKHINRVLLAGRHILSGFSITVFYSSWRPTEVSAILIMTISTLRAKRNAFRSGNTKLEYEIPATELK